MWGMDVRADQFRVAPMRRRKTGGQVSASQAIVPDMTLLDGNIRVFDVNNTSEVAPNGTVDVALTIDGGAIGSVMGDHPDCCGPFCHGLPLSSSQNGYRYQVEVVPQWTARETREPTCLDIDPTGSPDDSWSFDFPAPTSEGSYSIDIRVILPNSGRSNTLTRQVQVVEEADPRPGPDDCSSDADCAAGQVCENGECVPDPNACTGFLCGLPNPFAGLDNVGMILAAAVVLYFAAKLLLSRGGRAGGGTGSGTVVVTGGSN